MSTTTRSAQSFEHLRARAVAVLVPFFTNSSSGDENAARLAADSLLRDYDAGTPGELQLATQIIALGWAAMACLRSALAAKHLSLDDMLRLHDVAIALDRRSQNYIRTLKASRKERAMHPGPMTVEDTGWDEEVFQLTISHALAKLTDANARQATCMAIQAPFAPTRRPTFLVAEQMTSAVLARRTRD